MSILSPITGIPGIRAAQQAQFRALFKGGFPISYLPPGKLIDGVNASDIGNTPITNLRAGLLMGKITATGLYANSIIGVTNGAIAQGATSITVLAAVVTELVRKIGATGTFTLVGPSTANGVVATEVVTYSAASGTTITVTATQFAHVTASFIMPTDGSQTPTTLIADPDSGIPVIDFVTGSRQTVQFPRLPIEGCIDTSMIINYGTDTSLNAWIKARLNGLDGGQFTFTDRY